MVASSKLCRQLFKLLPKSYTRETKTWLVWSEKRTTLSDIPYMEYLNLIHPKDSPELIPAYNYNDLVIIHNINIHRIEPISSPTDADVDDLITKLISRL